ncbi:PPOX class putative F420-dependent enzyme [Gaiella occulta]|uniref:PPOX class putative F420-dependent enzyme n=2 Tax=Gaiella occulta TaxID=1002870 RepID=A0A7M2YU55_9ACTN|nr:PPOX class putative F420-dependent enzyme [Gaiella occulta]
MIAAMGALDPAIRDLARAANFAAFTTHLASGHAMTHVMWVDADDDHVLINTEVHRAKFKAVERDPRVTVTVWVKDDPYSYAEVRGRVVETVHGPKARAHIDALARKYLGRDYDPANIQSERVILRIAPDVQRVH